MSNKSGTLYIVATPIGNLDDMSFRAVEVLKSVSLVVAEDTRHSGRLLTHYGIRTKLTSLHEHNEREAAARVVTALQSGKDVALISDAGTPLISDPGFPLVRSCREQGIEVTAVPGPSAVIAALSVSGLPTDRFCFEGFLPRTTSARRQVLEQLAANQATLVFYESSHRIQAALLDMAAVLGPDRQALLAREMTKLHEELLFGSLQELIDQVDEDANRRKGEFVLVVAGAEARQQSITPEVERLLQILLEDLSLKQAAAIAARITGLKKNALYKAALAMEQGGSND